jgi:hypothetical protein
MFRFNHISLHADFIIMNVHVSCIVYSAVEFLYITKYP